MSEQITGYSVAGVIEADPDNEFVWVKFVACSAAVAAAEQRAGEEAHGHYMDGYNTAWSLSAAEIERQVREEEQVAQSLAVAESFAAGVKAARDAVAGLPVLLVDVRFNPDDASRYVGAVNVSDALAAIDALLKEKP